MPQPVLSAQGSSPCLAHATSIGMGHTNIKACTLQHWEAVCSSLSCICSCCHSPLPSPALCSCILSLAPSPSEASPCCPGSLLPWPSLLHHYSRWPENGTAIKTNSLDQVFHFSLSEQPGRMKGDKDDCKHHPCHPVNGRERAAEPRAGGWH